MTARLRSRLNEDIGVKVSRHVETVVTLGGVKTDSHITADLDVEKLGIHDNKATYDDIKAFVSDKYCQRPGPVLRHERGDPIPLIENED